MEMERDLKVTLIIANVEREKRQSLGKQKEGREEEDLLSGSTNLNPIVIPHSPPLTAMNLSLSNASSVGVGLGIYILSYLYKLPL
jgi:hypothetical protein